MKAKYWARDHQPGQISLRSFPCSTPTNPRGVAGLRDLGRPPRLSRARATGMHRASRARGFGHEDRRRWTLGGRVGGEAARRTHSYRAQKKTRSDRLTTRDCAARRVRHRQYNTWRARPTPHALKLFTSNPHGRDQHHTVSFRASPCALYYGILRVIYNK